MAGLFGGLFDFNHDGKMGCFERAMEFATFASIMDEDERREALENAGFDSDVCSIIFNISLNGQIIKRIRLLKKSFKYLKKFTQQTSSMIFLDDNYYDESLC